MSSGIPQRPHPSLCRHKSGGGNGVDLRGPGGTIDCGRQRRGGAINNGGQGVAGVKENNYLAAAAEKHIKYRMINTGKYD